MVLSLILVARLVFIKKQTANSFGKILDAVMWIVLINNILNLYFKNEFILKLYPVLMSLGMAGLFVHSLWIGEPIIEKFARLHEKDLSAEKLQYIRKLTLIWSVWLCVNASLALYTALYSSFDVWVLYNNVLFYVICGVLFLGDFSYRKLCHAKA